MLTMDDCYDMILTFKWFFATLFAFKWFLKWEYVSLYGLNRIDESITINNIIEISICCANKHDKIFNVSSEVIYIYIYICIRIWNWSIWVCFQLKTYPVWLTYTARNWTTNQRSIVGLATCKRFLPIWWPFGCIRIWHTSCISIEAPFEALYALFDRFNFANKFTIRRWTKRSSDRYEIVTPYQLLNVIIWASANLLCHSFPENPNLNSNVYW